MATTRWQYRPLVSGLLIVDQVSRLDLAKAVQRAFFAQNWPHLQLTVFNTTGKSLKTWFKPAIKEIALAVRDEAGMLDILRENAPGEWCLLLNDDTWYAPDLVEGLLQAAGETSAAVTLNATAYSVSSGQQQLIHGERAGVYAFKRLTPVDFRAGGYAQFPHLAKYDNPADAVVKFAARFI